MPSQIIEAIQANLDDEIIQYPENWLTADKIQPTDVQQFLSVNNTAITTNTAQCKFTIPTGASVFDLSSFVLNFQITGGIVANNTVLSNYTVANSVLASPASYLPFIQEISFFTDSGTILCNIKNVDQYSRLNAVLNLNPQINNGSTARGFMCKSQRIATQTPATITANQAYITDPYIVNAVNNAGILNQITAENIDAPAVLNYPYARNGQTWNPISVPTNTATGFSANFGDFVTGMNEIPANPDLGGIYLKNYSIRLGDLLVDSIFNVKKLVYLSKASFIQITWQKAANCFYAIQPLSTATAFKITTPPTGNYGYQITNLNLEYYRQHNPDIVKMIQEAQEKSQPFVVPFTEFANIGFTVPTNGTTQTQTSTFRLSSNNIVSTLYKTYFGIFADDGLLGLYCNSNNINEAILQQIQVNVNGYIVRNHDLTKQDDLNMYTKDNMSGASSYRAIRYAGVYPMCFDTNKMPLVYDGVSISGKILLPSNDIQITNQCVVGNPNGIGAYSYNNASKYYHTLFNVQLRLFYFKNGQLYTTLVEQ